MYSGARFSLALLNDISDVEKFSSPFDVTLFQLTGSLHLESNHLSLKQYLLL